MGVIAVFFSSLVALLALIGLKHWERRRGLIVLAHLRERADVWVVRGLIKLEHSVRGAFRFVGRKVIRGVHIVTLIALYVVRFLEQQLVSFISLIRGRHGRSRRLVSRDASHGLPTDSVHERKNGE